MIGKLLDLFSKEKPITSIQEFWMWFGNHSSKFFDVVQEHRSVDEDFFDPLFKKIQELHEGVYFLTGMEDGYAELVFSADGNVKNVAFVELLTRKAPTIKGWKFTSLKQALDINDLKLEMGNYTFTRDSIFFYSNVHDSYPDEIDITLVHLDLTKENEEEVSNGVYVFLDNFLGELNFIMQIDDLSIIGPNDASKELVPIERLKAFLNWRQKEFVEKYEETFFDPTKDSFSALKAETAEGLPIIVSINSGLLEWENKASHPWVVIFEITYSGGVNGMPSDDTYMELGKIEEALQESLIENSICINIGRQTAENKREIYFASKDFRKVSLIMHTFIKQDPSNYKLSFEIFKDKYWRSFERFNIS